MLKKLKAFCGSCKGTDKPFSQDDYTYATNGYILLRVPRMKTVKANPDAPDLKKESTQKDYLKYLGKEPCKWHKVKDVLYWQSRYKTNDAETAIKVGRAWFDLGWLGRIYQAFPDAEIGVFGELKPARLRFKGGDGLIMPTRRYW